MKVAKERKKPGRPPEPAYELGLTDIIWRVMTSCWEFDPSHRPSMRSITAKLSDEAQEVLIASITSENCETLNGFKAASSVTHTDIHHASVNFFPDLTGHIFEVTERTIVTGGMANIYHGRFKDAWRGTGVV